MTLLMKKRTRHNIRGLVSKILLEYARDGTGRRPRLTQRAIAEMIGTDGETVRAALISLQSEGIIRLEHLRIVVDNELLQRAAGVSENQ
jgi:DNA-binding GntR family transcriptional regulator